MPDYSRISCTACSAGPCNSAIRGTCWLGPRLDHRRRHPRRADPAGDGPALGVRSFFRRPHAHRRDVFCSGIGILPMMSAHHGQDARATFFTRHIVSAQTPLQGARPSRPSRKDITAGTAVPLGRRDPVTFAGKRSVDALHPLLLNPINLGQLLLRNPQDLDRVSHTPECCRISCTACSKGSRLPPSVSAAS